MSEEKYNQDNTEGMSYEEMEKGKEEALNSIKENIKKQNELNSDDYGGDIVIEHHTTEEDYEEEEIEIEDSNDIEEEEVREDKGNGEVSRSLEDELEYSSEATGIDLYYSGELYNSEENISKREEDKNKVEKEKRPTQTTELSSINLDVILNHVNSELKNKGVHHLVYYKSINYSVGRFEDSFLTEVNVWIKYRSILKNGKGENDNTYLVTIPLGEEDMMMFDGKQDANEYLSEIGEEDAQVKSKGIEEYEGLKYLHFNSEINDRLIKEEMTKYKEYIKSIPEEEYKGMLGEHFNDKGEMDYKEEVPEEDKEELDSIRDKENEDKQKEEVGDNVKSGGDTDDSVLISDDISPEPEYIKVSVEDVITQLRKRDIAMGGTHQYVDRKHEELKQQGVTDVYLKDILFEYEWDRLAELNNVSRVIYFYYDLELVTARGIVSDRYSLKVPLDMLFKGEDIYYVSKGQFKDLIVNTESLVDEFKKEDYFRYLYKGIAVYLGTKGGKQYKEYIKENGIKKSKEDEQKVLGSTTEGNQSKVDLDDADEVNSLEDMAELVRRMYQDVHHNVEDSKLKKAYEMFNIFLRKAQKQYKGRISVQPHTKFKGLWIVTAEGGNLLNTVNIGGGTREKSKKREEHLILHPFFAIASNGDNVSRVVYKRRTTNMSLGDYESMLVYNGYDELTDIAKFMNLKNYSKVIGFNNKFVNDSTKAFGRQATRATGRAMWKGSVWAGRKLIGTDKKGRR